MGFRYINEVKSEGFDYNEPLTTEMFSASLLNMQTQSGKSYLTNYISQQVNNSVNPSIKAPPYRKPKRKLDIVHPGSIFKIDINSDIFKYGYATINWDQTIDLECQAINDGYVDVDQKGYLSTKCKAYNDALARWEKNHTFQLIQINPRQNPQPAYHIIIDGQRCYFNPKSSILTCQECEGYLRLYKNKIDKKCQAVIDGYVRLDKNSIISENCRLYELAYNKYGNGSKYKKRYIPKEPLIMEPLYNVEEEESEEAHYCRFKTHIYRVIQKYYPGLGISIKAMDISNELINSVLKKIIQKDAKLIISVPSRLIQLIDLKFTFKDIFPSGLNQKIVYEAEKAINLYKNNYEEYKKTEIFPFARVFKYINEEYKPLKITLEGTVFITAALQYIATLLIKPTGRFVKKIHDEKISPHHLSLVIANDAILKKLFDISNNENIQRILST